MALFTEVLMSHIKLQFSKVASCMAAGILIPYLLTSLVRIHGMEEGRIFIMIPFIMAFVSDSGAYFVGRAIGKHKLAPVVSPKKTIEGAVGGLVSSMIVMCIFAAVLQLGFQMKVNYAYALIYGVIGSLGSVFGDLCLSVIKRQTGIKDYGHLIPGHGGVLDRFDSMLVAGPVAELLLLVLPFALR
jgi:phosphatidate cytidylyltransferase